MPREEGENTPNSRIKGGCFQPGYLYLGEAISNKHAERVFIKGQRISLRGGEPDYIARLDKVWEAYNDEAVNRNLNGDVFDSKTMPHYGYQGYEKAKKKGVIPIWYQLTNNGKGVRLSLAAIGRMIYDNTLADIANAGNPCRSRTESICEACALFGMVGGKGDQESKGLGSRVRFTDAVLSKGKEPNMIGTVLLKELSSPKPSYRPFYTEKGADYDDSGIKIRGRKFYWHHPDVKRQSYEGKDASRSARHELMDKGAEFTFRVYYDRITAEQRNKLAWALTLGDQDDTGNHMIKIGHGKPLGLGSAKVVIENVRERNISGNYTIKNCKNDLTSFICLGKQEVENNEGYKELMCITDYDAIKGVPIEYPYVDNLRINKDTNDGGDPNRFASHQWFTSYKGRRKDDVPGQLPHIPAIDESKESKGNRKLDVTASQTLYPYHYDPKANPKKTNNGVDADTTPELDGPGDTFGDDDNGEKRPKKFTHYRLKLIADYRTDQSEFMARADDEDASRAFRAKEIPCIFSRSDPEFIVDVTKLKANRIIFARPETRTVIDKKTKKKIKQSAAVDWYTEEV